MRPTHLAAAALAVLLLSGCSPSADPTGTPGPSASVSASASASASAQPSASPSPSSTLTAAQEQAFEEATDVVMAYSQTITDLYSGARTRINDLDNYVTGELLTKERTAVSLGVRKGIRSEPTGVQLALVDAEPVAVKLKKDPPTVVVRACIDATAVTDVLADGSRRRGVREELDYTVVKTAYLPAPGWAVSRVTGEEAEKDRAC